MLRIKVSMNGLVSLLAGILFVGMALSAVPAQALTCKVAPNEIPINLMYNGATLTVTGVSAPGDDLIVKVSSKTTDVHLKYKGKASGLFWMKMGNMEFKNVPNVYMLYSTGSINNLLDAEGRAANMIGYDAIRAGSEMERSDGVEVESKWFDEFLKFKKTEKLYSSQEGTIVRKQSAAGNEFSMQVAWPFQAPPATYTVDVYAVRDGKVVDQSSAPITVAQAGIVKQLSGMAFNNSAVYGVLAVIIAMVAGFAVGAVFKGGGSH
ncbi:MAG: TIGR02186 family protein [Desulfobulbaceae bacterium]|nr:TIGR02186 family protein [Desulfobulbaceae bacterium]